MHMHFQRSPENNDYELYELPALLHYFFCMTSLSLSDPHLETEVYKEVTKKNL